MHWWRRQRINLRGTVGLALWALVTIVPPSWGQVRRQFDVRMPMRDGVMLSADLWLPEESGPHPVILMRTPYHKTMALLEFPELGLYFASRGYVLAVQDVRGRGDSEGTFEFFFADGADGYDSVEWLADQPWSNGRVCMMGVSYLGSVQWLAARERPPHLVCIVPTAAAGFDRVFNYQGGAFLMGWALPWTNHVSGRIQQDNNERGLDWAKIYRHRPLSTMDEALGRRMPLFREFVQYGDLDPHWQAIHFGPDDFQKMDIPALHVTGWFDGDQPAALHYWDGMAAHSPAKEQQYVIIGPWTHVQTFIGGQLQIGELSLPGESVIDTRALHLAFFDHYLKGTAASFDFPRARIYVTGSNRWRAFDQYPPVEAQVKRLYLRGGGRANSLIGDGRLSWDRPTAEPPDRYTYDPHHPAPSAVGGGGELPLDHRPIERRDDVLVYTSEVLAEPLEVVGRISVTLYAASDALDTDFTAKLLDVYPDGRAIRLGTLPIGVVRARYRHGYGSPELLTPGRTEEYRIDLFDVGHAFLPGHRVRLEISSSAVPFVSANQNTGNPVATDTEWRVAHQTIYHDRQRPSHVSLPVMPN